MERHVMLASTLAILIGVTILWAPVTGWVPSISTIFSWFGQSILQPAINWRRVYHDRGPSSVAYEIHEDIRYHLGGNGPWIRKIHEVAHEGIELPETCRVDQVHMLSRHAERYPTIPVGIRMLELYHRIQDENTTWQGDLSFLNEWDFFTLDPTRHFESLVTTGPYAGTLEAFSTGVKLRTRYQHLLEDAVARNATSLWASDSQRDIDTAKYFGAGFFGIDWEAVSRLTIIPETAGRGADTLTPGRTCLNYQNDVDNYGHAYGYRMMDAFRSTYEPAITNRLAKAHAPFRFREDEVFTMQLLCGFETLAKGKSDWCEVFTRTEWEAFEYARDIIHYYRAGPGNPYSASMGWLWLNATARLLQEGPSAGPLFFSFVHDGDILPMLTALDLFQQSPDLPITHVVANRTWRTSDVVPMGGRVILERLTCGEPPQCWSNAPFYPNHVYCEENTQETFVRVNINDGIVAIPNCKIGPGDSCPLMDFLELVRRRGNGVTRFGDICGLDRDGAREITFLHQ